MAPQETKARAFIGSSSEGKPVAEYLKEALADCIEPTVWTEGVFRLSEGTLQSLIKASEDFDLAILVLTSDDVVTKRRRRRPTARDNLIFEAGLFMGSLGPERTFLVSCEDDNIELPSNLAGVTRATYSIRDGGDVNAALSLSAVKIRKAIKEAQARESSGAFGEAVFTWMNLPKGARKKLGRSEFVKSGGTQDALMALIERAEGDCSILAICGYKGSYSNRYYEENFRKCKAVKRVFSYDAIVDEFKAKKECYALKGLKMHRSKAATGECDVEVFFVPKGKRIKDLGDRTFDPPLSFGLAVLLDGGSPPSPKEAVVHWEINAEPLKHLIAIEGVIIDGGQEILLNKLVKLHESIAGSNTVLSSRRDSKAISAACAELERIWESRYRAGKRGEG